MVVRDFLRWLDTASPARRADAAGALARGYLHGDLEDETREDVEAALTLLLDDPAPTVRLAVADALGNSPVAPRHVILGLAADTAEVAAVVLRRSPLIADGELVDLVAGMDPAIQEAIAGRFYVSTGVAAAIAELGTSAACRVLAANYGAEVAYSSLRRLVERHGKDGILRDALLSRPDLPVGIRQALVRALSSALSDMVSARAWLDPDRATTVTRDACDRATVTIVGETDTTQINALVEHLRASGQLTTSLLLRAVCSGNLSFFATALSVLARMPQRRVQALVFDARIGALRAVYGRAGLPTIAFDAFAAAVRTCRLWQDHEVDPTMRARFVRRMVDDVLARYEAVADTEMNELTAMLRRFAADAARAAAREFAVSEARAA